MSAPTRRLSVRLCIALVSATLGSAGLFAQNPGRNVNMVSGTTLPDGDPHLQRQNESSIAVSTRNPLHLLGGANDYRTVDLPGLPDDKENGDAWLGLFKSFDGGLTWKALLLPGYPQDHSPNGLASPLHGYQAGADPIVRAGVNGLFFYTGIAFNRGAVAPGAVFVARFIDNNNKENGDPIAYLGTSVVAQETSAKFIDKPWLAVDIPRGNGDTCKINGQRVAAGNVYLVYTVFSGPGAAAAALGDRDDDGDRDSTDKDKTDKDKGDDDKLHGKIMFSSSKDCGDKWSKPTLISASMDVNQGAAMAIDPSSGAVYVAWRQFADTALNIPNAILVAQSKDGKKFDPPVRIATTQPLDQGTSPTSFRTNAYPTIAIDETGRVYVAWSARGFAPMRPDPVTGDGRIVMSTSTNGAQWTVPRAIDNVLSTPGHEIMPALAYAAGKLQIAYYDLRQDVSQIYGPFVDDYNLPIRHTIDVRSAQASPGASPVFTVYSVTSDQPSARVSAYLHGSRPGQTGMGAIEQLQFNPPNLPMFKLGTVPFLGDYIDVAAAPAFVPVGKGGWAFNTASTNAAVFHVTWTDNRDVRGPRDGNWANYTPPIYTGPPLDPAHPLPACQPGQSGMRNQNVYTSRITPNLLVGSPGNSKPLSSTLQRGFVVFAQNSTNLRKTYQFAIQNQPPGGRASFSQFPLPPFNSQSPAPLTVVYATVPAHSMAARTVYATSTDPHARIDVSVAETSAVNVPPPANAERSAVAINPDIANPDIANPDIANPDIANPDIANAEIVTPDIANPDIANPDIANPDIANPDIANPDIANVLVVNPDIANTAINPDIANPDIANPDIANPDIANPDIANGTLTDVIWTTTNTGNTTAAYSTRLLLGSNAVPAGNKLQLIVNKTYKTPVSVECELKTMVQNQVVVNVNGPALESAAQIKNADPNDPNGVTFFLAPGETAKIVLRVATPSKVPAVVNQVIRAIVKTVIPAVKAQEVNTPAASGGQTTTTPVFPPSASALAFVVQPSDATTGQAIAPPVRIRVTDATTTVVPGATVHMALASNAAVASLTGGLTAITNTAGIATFNNLEIDRAGDGFHLIASTGALTPATSGLFGVTGFNAGVCPTPTFARTQFAAGTFPHSVAVGDFNGDGRRDFAVGTATGLTVFLQDVGGSFTAQPDINLGDEVDALAVGDMNGDGKLDIVAGLTAQHLVQVLTGDGAGGFVTGASANVNGQPRTIVLADLNGDFRPDVIASGGMGFEFAVALNNGTGGLGAAIMRATSGTPSAIVAGDFNGDGRVDLVVNQEETSAVQVLLGDGTGHFTTGSSLVIPNGIGRLALGDFDGDGIVDLAALTVSDSTVHILRGSGTGTFTPFASTASAATPTRIVAGDFDGDGNLDVAVVASGGIYVHKGDGAGHLAAATLAATAGAGSPALAAGDLNGDGKLDLLVIDVSAAVTLTNACGSVPTITPAVTGTAGGSGWYRSDVNVSWTVTDPVGILSKVGCDPTTITSETAGTLLTCTATNLGGGVANSSVTIKIDKTAPSILSTIVNPPPNAAGWNRTVPVTVSLTGVDVGPVQSGLAGCGSIQVNANTPGASVSPSCADVAGNVQNVPPVLVKVDQDAPLIAFGTPEPPIAPGGTSNRDVIVPYTIADALSGVASQIPLPVYVTTFINGSVVRVDGQSGHATTIYEGGGSNYSFAPAISPVNGLLYLADDSHNRIIRMDQTGRNATVVYEGQNAVAPNNPSRVFGLAFKPNGDLVVGARGSVWQIAGGVPGTAPVQLFATAGSDDPGGVAFDPGTGDIYVVDIAANQVVRASPPYTTPTVLISGGACPNLNELPCFAGIAFNASGDVFVSDLSANAILRFSAAGAPLGTFASFTAPETPVFMQFDAAGEMWVSATEISSNNAANGRVWRISPLGVKVLITPVPLQYGALGVTLPPLGPTVYGTLAIYTSGTATVNTSDVAGNLANATTDSYFINPAFADPNDFVVTNTQDSGAGSLRQAIVNANAHAGVDTVTFNITGGGVKTIAPVTALPRVTDPAILDATSQPGYLGTPLIELSGVQAGPSAVGFTVSAGNSTIKGFTINRFKPTSSTVFGNGAGIQLDTLGFNHIEGNYIGTNAAGTGGAGNSVGIRVLSPSNVIGGTTPAARNVISGNNGNNAVGVLLGAEFDDSNVLVTSSNGSIVQGNYIGTNAAGTAAVPNQSGVSINAPNITVGGAAAGAGNVISGNSFSGVFIGVWTISNNIVGTMGTGAIIQGNRIGTNATGTAAVPNGAGVGINVPGAHIGGTGVGEGNLISGNNNTGVSLNHAFSSFPGPGNFLFASGTGTFIEGNVIGLNAAGTGKIPNRNSGISVQTSGNMISANVIAGNGTLPTRASGISISPSTTVYTNAPAQPANNNAIVGNYFGTDAAGTGALGNSGSGVQITNASNTVVGGAGAGRNVISGNGQNGVSLFANALGMTGNQILNNYIGVKPNGTAALGNGSSGVSMNITIGVGSMSATTIADNVISGNSQSGINNFRAGNVIVTGNKIGTDKDGAVAIANLSNGIQLSGVSFSTIGGNNPATRNVVSGNAQTGIFLGAASGVVSDGNVITGNYVGTNDTGTAAIPNNIGISLSPQPGGTVSNTTIGGTSLALMNLVSGNNSTGVSLFSAGTINNTVVGNFVGTNLAGTSALANLGGGVNMSGSGNIIGGTTAGAGNLISGNGTPSGSGSGIGVNTNATSNTIQGNKIGTDVTGTSRIPNTGGGVNLNNGSTLVGGGGGWPGAGNLISGNGAVAATAFGTGINVGSGSSGNTIQGNRIGATADGMSALYNVGGGLNLNNSSSNTIGGTGAGEGNLIAGNNFVSVAPQNFSVGINIGGGSGNTVQGNTIGLNLTGTAALPNSDGGININNTNNTVIGGTTAAARNLISGNGVSPRFANGVYIGSSATGTQVLGNWIGVDGAGTGPMGNLTAGVYIAGGSGNFIGGGGPLGIAGNVISSNGNQGGVNIIKEFSTNITPSGNWVLGNYIGLDKDGHAGPGLGNAGAGVGLSSGAHDNHIGSSASGARNVIAASGNQGISIYSSSSNIIQGNYIGVDVTGATAVSNNNWGIGIGTGAGPSDQNKIGGINPGEGNVIAGNPSGNIGLFASDVTNTQIQGNFIGVNAAGTAGFGVGQQYGVNSSGASGTIIGSPTLAGGRNVISGHQSNIRIVGGSGGTIVGNYIGTNAAGTAAIANNGYGLLMQATSNNVIGGAGTDRNVISGNSTAVWIFSNNAEVTNLNTLLNNLIGTAADGVSVLGNNTGVLLTANVGGFVTATSIDGNTIANSNSAGIAITGNGAIKNPITRNSISNNTGLGIDLGNDGVTPNDFQDLDGGPNEFQNYPLLSGATTSTGTSGEIFSAPFGTYNIEIFQSDTANREGRTWVGSVPGITTDAAGHAFFSATVPLTTGKWITVTATDANGNTSEFSVAVIVS